MSGAVVAICGWEVASDFLQVHHLGLDAAKDSKLFVFLDREKEPATPKREGTALNAKTLS